MFDAVLSLPAAFKDAVILFYYQEFDTLEISQILGVAPGTVRSRLHRGREILKSKIDGRIDFSG